MLVGASNEVMHLMCVAMSGLCQPRSNLFCHHFKITPSNQWRVRFKQTTTNKKAGPSFQPPGSCRLHADVTGLVCPVLRQTRPDDPGMLVGQRHCRNVRI